MNSPRSSRKPRRRRNSMMPSSKPFSRGSTTLSSLPSDQRSETSSNARSRSSHKNDNTPSPATNILVAVRVRPGLPSEEPNIHDHLYDIVKEGPLAHDAKKLAYDTEHSCVSGQKDYDVVPHTYTYDSLFGPNATNPIVYNQAIKPVVNSVLDGYHATVFAYGMTGSGKTHTMVGNSKDPGIIPLSFEQIFKQVEANAETTDYSISISYLEIYCEIVRDIIEPERTNLNICEDLELGVHIQGVSTHLVYSWEETKALLDKGAENRAVTATEMNAESSRSHAVLVAKVTQEIRATKERSQAKLFLVDLAGSERIGKSGVTGVALEEAKAINLSLTTLGLCIKALVDVKKPHVPFRSSKLTRLLKESLGGKARTCLIVAVRPGQPHIEETLSALQFGNRARKIKVHASKNVHKNWKLECNKLEGQLKESQKKNNKQFKLIMKLKKKLRNGEGGDDYISEEEEDDDDSEDEDNGDSISGLKNLKTQENNKTAKRRRQSLHAAKVHKQALALQLKEMQQAMEQKLAEASSQNQSKEDEIDMFKRNIRDLKKNANQLQNLVTKLQEEVYQNELEKTELSASKEKLETELQSFELQMNETITKTSNKRVELETNLITMTASMNASHNDLREIEMELRRAGSDNDTLRGEIHGIHTKHETELGQAKVQVINMKKELDTKSNQFKAQLRASDHRHREIVRRLHDAERKVESKEHEVQTLQLNIESREDRVLDSIEDVELERLHSSYLVQILTKVRNQVLKLHLTQGNGIDKKLQRISFVLSKVENDRRSQLKRERDRLTRIKEQGSTKSSKMKNRKSDQREDTQDEEMGKNLIYNEECLLKSLNQLIIDVKLEEKKNLDGLWERERRKHKEEESHWLMVNDKLRMQGVVERERSEYALTLVKAMKPLIQQTLVKQGGIGFASMIKLKGKAKHARENIASAGGT